MEAFIRLNLSGKSYGLAYVNEELACVFANIQQKILLPPFYLRSQRPFPHCLVLKMGKICSQEVEPEVVTKTEAPQP